MPHPPTTVTDSGMTTSTQVLHGLASPLRLLLLDALRGGPQTVGELVEQVTMEQSAVSHQLRVLRDLRLVVAERQGRHVLYTFVDDHLGDVIDQALAHAEHLAQAD